MSRRAVYQPVENLRQELTNYIERAKRNPPAISTELRLAITVEIMAGGRVVNLMLIIKVLGSTSNRIFHDTVKVIARKMQLPGICSDTDDVLKFSDDLNFSRPFPSPLHGCIGEMDGISIKIDKPPQRYYPREFYIRKGYYAISVQAVVDSRYRLL